MTAPHADWDKLGRYFAGELSHAEAEDVRRWLDENAADARVLARLDELTRNVAPARAVDVEAALGRVKSRLRPATSWRRYASLAAAAALILVAGLVWRANRREPTSEPGAATYATAVGARDSVLLADGSRVVLGPATRIVARERDVELVSGEAFFAATHDAARPFTVRVAGVAIRDMGTEFSVHSDPGEAVRVVVREGSVELRHRTASVVLAAGDVGGVGSTGQLTAQRGAATDDDLAWTRGRLVFRDAPVAELGADLRRWYGVELRVTDSMLARRHFTGSFDNEPAERVVAAVALALGARADRRGDTVFIRAASR